MYIKKAFCVLVFILACSANADEKVLFAPDLQVNGLSGKQQSGSFKFNNWAGSTAPVSGGITGSKPEKGEEIDALKVVATDKGYSGRISPAIVAPENMQNIIITGQIKSSQNYEGNTPFVFVWMKGEEDGPRFLPIYNIKSDKWSTFKVEVKREHFVQGLKSFQVNFISMKNKNSAKPEVSGAVYYKDIKVSYE